MSLAESYHLSNLHYKKKDLWSPSLGFTPVSYLAMSGCRSYEMLLKIRPRSTKESVNQLSAYIWQWSWRSRVFDTERSEFKTSFPYYQYELGEFPEPLYVSSLKWGAELVVPARLLSRLEIIQKISSTSRLNMHSSKDMGRPLCWPEPKPWS